MFYGHKQPFHSTYVVVTLESDITFGNSLDFFLAEHGTHIIQLWFPESLRLKTMFHSAARSRTYFNQSALVSYSLPNLYFIRT